MTEIDLRRLWLGDATKLSLGSLAAHLKVLPQGSPLIHKSDREVNKYLSEKDWDVIERWLLFPIDPKDTTDGYSRAGDWDL